MTDSIEAPGPRPLDSVLEIHRRGINAWWEPGCGVPATCRVSALRGSNGQERPATTDQRGKFALVGLVVGAAAGWGVYAYQCTHGSDCYSPVGGVLLAAAGGALGLLVGVLIAPGPPAR